MVLLDLDLAKAFDPIPREFGLELLEHMGIAPGMVQAQRDCAELLSSGTSIGLATRSHGAPRMASRRGALLAASS